MSDFLLELLSEEIPARMQAKARADLARLFAAELAKSGLAADKVETFSTPRRLVLIARGLPLGTPAQSEELKGPRTSAPPQALEGFLRKTGLSQDQLVDRGGTWFALIEKPGRATTDVLAEAIPAIVRAFPWPKSMRWGAASLSTESLRWVRPLQGIVAMLDEEVVEFEIGDVSSGAATVGHRFHHPGPITLAGAKDYAEKLKACHVIVDHDERARIIRDGAAAAASAAGLALVPDEGLVEENAGLTEWPVPLLGRFDESFLQVPREVIQLTMRTNQKYFALTKSSPAPAGEGDRSPQASGGEAGEAGTLAPAFICVANIAATDGGARIVEGNQKVLAARLSDARFFWEQDLKVSLDDQAAKLSQIVFHEKLGTVADKVERVAKLARWLVEEGIVGGPNHAAPTTPAHVERSRDTGSSEAENQSLDKARQGLSTSLETSGTVDLAALAERAARLCKADLVTQMVGEFPELQGLIGGYLAAAQGEDPQVAAAIRDHYKPVGQGDDVPTAPVTVAVSLADKLDTISNFFAIQEIPSGSRDPFALRRSALGAIALIRENSLRVDIVFVAMHGAAEGILKRAMYPGSKAVSEAIAAIGKAFDAHTGPPVLDELMRAANSQKPTNEELIAQFTDVMRMVAGVRDFFLDRLEVAERAGGARIDLLRAAQSTDGDNAKESDVLRLLARVRALQAFVETREGADLLAGYKRAANILKKEGWTSETRRPGLDPGQGSPSGDGTPDSPDQVRGAENGTHPDTPSYAPEPAERDLIAALDASEPRVAAAIAAEQFEAAMAALAALRAPVDAFFEKVIVNDPDPGKRAARLALLARIRNAAHQVADFSRIEG